MSDKKTLTKTIEDIDMFSVFARLMRTSETNDLITDGGPFTIFAPTNDAFGNVPEKTMNGWLSETKQSMLRGILAYHIVASKLMAASLGGSLQSAFSIAGQAMQFTDTSGLRVNGARILARNLEATNGIIHAVDTVLYPAAAAAIAGDLSAAANGSRLVTKADSDPASWKLS